MPEKGTGVKDQAAAGDEIEGAITTPEGVKMVPLTALQGARTEAKTAKDTAQALQDQNDLYKAYMAQGQSQQTQVADKGPLEGLEDADVVTVADVKKVLSTQDARWGEIASQLKVGQTEPEYLQTIEKYLPGELAKDPDLAAAIKTSSNPALLALRVAKGSAQYIKDEQEKVLAQGEQVALGPDGKPLAKNSNAQQILDNQNKPGATSTGAGAGGGVNSIDFYTQMSEDDLEKRIEAVNRKG